MAENKHRKELIDGIFKQFEMLFENSQQAVYIFMDDTYKVCNKKFSSLLGYKSPDEWAKVNKNVPSVFVADKSVKTLINAYRNAMEKMIGSNFNVTWKKKSGGTVDTNVILVPIVYQEHLFALHFVSKK